MYPEKSISSLKARFCMALSSVRRVLPRVRLKATSFSSVSDVGEFILFDSFFTLLRLSLLGL